VARPDDLVITPNALLRMARLRLLSPSGSGRPMSRQELADAVNARVHEISGGRLLVDATYVGRLERGETRWPQTEVRRRAFREVLRVGSDAALGFWRPRSRGDRAFLEERAASAVSAAQVVPAVAVREPVAVAVPAPVAGAALSFTVEGIQSGGVRIIVHLGQVELCADAEPVVEILQPTVRMLPDAVARQEVPA
jgi:hypothetical protein